MLPDPLHPAVVHFPIVFMFLLPISAAVAMWAIGRGARVARAWAVPATVAVALAASAWLSVETGEGQEDRVEDVIGSRAVATHADAAETFLALSAGTLVLFAAGAIRGRVGAVARGVSTAAAVGLVVAGVRVGHSGGQLVYQHGAASAYVASGARGDTAARSSVDRERGGRDRDDDGAGR